MKVNTKKTDLEATKPAPAPTDGDSNRPTAALELLREILENGTNHHRRYCLYCKVAMAVPLELHRKDCTWRRAWQLVNEKKE
jgi:hypothetical protein